MNVAARLVFVSSKCDHITPLLRQLHWLKVPWRIDYKLAVLVYKCLHGLAPTSPSSRISFAGICIPLRLMNCQPTATELFQLPLYGSGTVFHSISHLLRHFLSSALAWRHTSSNYVTRNYCCRAREVTLSFVYMLIALTYLLCGGCCRRMALRNLRVAYQKRRRVTLLELYIDKNKQQFKRYYDMFTAHIWMASKYLLVTRRCPKHCLHSIWRVLHCSWMQVSWLRCLTTSVTRLNLHMAETLWQVHLLTNLFIHLWDPRLISHRFDWTSFKSFIVDYCSLF